MALNYLGPTMPNGPVTNVLPPSNPGTMPAAIPGAPAANPPLPPAPAIRRPVPGQSGAPLAALAAIMRHPGVANALRPPPPPQYKAVTQSNGSVLLHQLGPNGQLGPAVKIIPPIHQHQAAGGKK